MAAKNKELTVRIPVELARRVEALASLRGEKVSSFVAQALEAYATALLPPQIGPDPYAGLVAPNAHQEVPAVVSAVDWGASNESQEEL